MNSAIKFCLRDREVNAEPFHYQMSGLDDVYLLNGFKVYETPYGKGVSVERSDELHMAIGMHLITNRKVLSPKDFKFLRKNMKLTQDEMADRLGVTDQTIARYEKGQTEIPGPVDRLMRVCYVFNLLPEKEKVRVVKKVMQAVKSLKGTDETVDPPVFFGSTPDGEWDKASPVRSVMHELA